MDIKTHPEKLKEGAQALRTELKENGFGKVLKVRESLFDGFPRLRHSGFSQAMRCRSTQRTS